MKNRSNQNIEAIRYISCLTVLIIHLNTPDPLNTIVDKYGRFAVPFFLLVSGYYSYGYNLSVKAKKKLRQTSRIILIHGTVCIVWNFINSYLRTGAFTTWVYPYLSFTTLKHLLFYNRAVFINSSFYYFFMLIYVYAICIVIEKQKIKKLTYVYSLSFVLYILGYCILHFTMYKWYHVGNFLFTGLPIFFIGHFIHRFSIPKLIKRWSILLLFLSILLTYLETTLLHGTYTTVGQLLFAISILTICLNNTKNSASILAKIGSECSMFVVIYHCQIRDTVRLFMKSDKWYFLFIVILLSSTLGLILSKMKQSLRKLAITNTE